MLGQHVRLIGNSVSLSPSIIPRRTKLYPKTGIIGGSRTQAEIIGIAEKPNHLRSFQFPFNRVFIRL